jgi:hypothetical protein
MQSSQCGRPIARQWAVHSTPALEQMTGLEHQCLVGLQLGTEVYSDRLRFFYGFAPNPNTRAAFSNGILLSKILPARSTSGAAGRLLLG